MLIPVAMTVALAFNPPLPVKMLREGLWQMCRAEYHASLSICDAMSPDTWPDNEECRLQALTDYQACLVTIGNITPQENPFSPLYIEDSENPLFDEIENDAAFEFLRFGTFAPLWDAVREGLLTVDDFLVLYGATR